MLFMRIGQCHSGTRFKAISHERDLAATYLNFNTYQMQILRMRILGDRDQIFREEFRRRVIEMRIEEVMTAHEARGKIRMSKE
jgi:hypothetical protein